MKRIAPPGRRDPRRVGSVLSWVVLLLFLGAALSGCGADSSLTITIPGASSAAPTRTGTPPSATPTGTPRATGTRPATPTATASPLPTSTPSSEPTGTETAPAVPTSSVTPSMPPLATVTETVAPPPSNTITATAVVAPTLTLGPTITATTEPSSTATEAATAPPSATTTASPTPTGPAATAAATATTTASTTPTATRTPTASTASVCGNGTVEAGESCDDGNTLDGDACPSDCKIQICAPDASMRTIAVDFAVPAGSNVGSLTVFVQYPDGTVQIPGSKGDASVSARITNKPGGFLVDGFDFDYALRVAIAGSRALTPGQLFRVNFDHCQSAPEPTVGEFACAVQEAFNTSFQPVNGVTCSVSFP